MIQRIKHFFELVSDAFYGLRHGFGFRFVLANFIMNDELREAVVFARFNVKQAIEYIDIAPEFSKKRLNKAYKYLDDFLNYNKR